MKRNCFNCIYYDYYPLHNVYNDYKLLGVDVCWNGVNTEENDPVKYIDDPEKEHECFLPKNKK